jgi:hypothetical protein
MDPVSDATRMEKSANHGDGINFQSKSTSSVLIRTVSSIENDMVSNWRLAGGSEN